MGSTAHVVIVGGDPDLAELARDRVAELEGHWSRFLPDSEISALNTSGGAPVVVGADTRLLIERSIECWKATGGLFDPTVLTAVVAAGYDRSFEVLDKTQLPAGPAGGGEVGPAPGAGLIELDAQSSSVTLPVGTGFDPGGIGKGLAADLTVADLLAAGAAGACVNLGGDVRVDGEAPTSDGWQIAIEHPAHEGQEVARVGLLAGAVATSTARYRSWTQGGQPRHHLIDPRTAMPTTTPISSVSIVAGAGWWAEALTKAVYVGGPEAATDLLAAGSATGMLVMEDGTVNAFPGFWDVATCC
jgi:thiamine biosynthesis lipoprotein